MKEISLLAQLIKSLEESVDKIEDAYEKKDYENFNSLKKLAMQTQNKIEEALNE